MRYKAKTSCAYSALVPDRRSVLVQSAGRFSSPLSLHIIRKSSYLYSQYQLLIPVEMVETLTWGLWWVEQLLFHLHVLPLQER